MLLIFTLSKPSLEYLFSSFLYSITIFETSLNKSIFSTFVLFLIEPSKYAPFLDKLYTFTSYDFENNLSSTLFIEL